MEKRYLIVQTKRSKNDLQSIFTYVYNESKSYDIAEYVIYGISDAISAVGIFPTKHRIDPTLNNPDIRFTIKWKYKILFRISQTKIEILRIFHTSQSPQKLKK